MTAAFVMKNLFDYDRVLPVPKGVPNGLRTVYLTDNPQTAKRAKQCGWQQVIVIDVGEAKTSQDRLDAVCKINSFPGLYLDSTVEHAFLVDGNVVRLDTNYAEFVSKSIKSEKTLYVHSGYYSGARNSIIAELEQSMLEKRWLEWRDNTIARTAFYVQDLADTGIAQSDLVPVVSAKYFGWNLRKIREDPALANFLQAEYKLHNQGNIILSYLAARYPECVYHDKDFKNDGLVTSHAKSLI